MVELCKVVDAATEIKDQPDHDDRHKGACDFQGSERLHGEKEDENRTC